jgi:hypothetical protein
VIFAGTVAGRGVVINVIMNMSLVDMGADKLFTKGLKQSIRNDGHEKLEIGH